MLTLKDINKEIESIPSTDTKGMNKRQVDKLKDRLSLFYNYKSHLESCPSEDFLEKERQKLSKIIDGIVIGYDAWYSGGNAPKDMDLKEIRGYYDKIMNIKHYKRQLKTIEFILT